MADDPNPTPDPEPDPTPDPQPDPDPTPDPDPKPDTEATLRAENQRLKREAAEREKERRNAEKAARKAEEQRQADQGEWKKLAEERAATITQLEAQIADRDHRDAERNQRTTVETVAERLNFRRPRRAYALLMDELDAEEASHTLADEQLTEAALKRLAKAEPELIDTQRRSGAPIPGRSRNGMTEDQIAAQESAEFVLGILGQPPQ